MINISFSLKLQDKMDPVDGHDHDNDVIDLTKSPPDPAPASPPQNMEVSLPVPVTAAAVPFIQPRVLFPVGPREIPMPPLINPDGTIQVRLDIKQKMS